MSGEPEDVTVRLSGKTREDLGAMQRFTELSRTTLINRSIQVYRPIAEAVDLDGADVLLVYPDGRSMIWRNSALRTDG